MIIKTGINRAQYQKDFSRFQTIARVNTCIPLRPPNSIADTTNKTAAIERKTETNLFNPDNSLWQINQTVTASVNALITWAIFPVVSKWGITG